MEPDRWKLVDLLLQAVLDRTPAERDGFLRQACTGDAELEREVYSLLISQQKAGSFLEMDAMEVAARALARRTQDHADSLIGKTLSHYRIVEKLGGGGMGVVYMAEQENPRRIVALKVIKPGFANAEVIRRFQQESRALARLQHPGIAQIYEAGAWDTGAGPQPYLAMEFIRGYALPDYVETRRPDVRQRLHLLAKICEAVEHAHQRGIIHRDLKPGNIIIGEDDQPRILDFGVARVTSSEPHATGQTDLGQLIGTLAYMSPEQVLADPLELDTRSDVYALGVILYELLAGRLPYTLGRLLHESIRTIREQDAAPLSSICRLYRGDIETIVKKALEKDKERRYASVADFGADICRFLKDEPIAARRPAATYRLQKFATRHKALTALLVVVFILLVAGITASSWEAARAQRAELSALRERDRASASEQIANEERDRALAAERAATMARNLAVAETQRADTKAAVANAVDDFLTNDLLAQAGADAQAQPNIRPDPDLKVRTALDRAAARLAGKFRTQPLIEASIRQTIGNAYTQLGLYPEAQKHLERALELQLRTLGQNDSETLNTMYDLACNLYRYQREYARAEGLFRKVLQTRRHVLGPEHPLTLETMNKLADLYRYERKYTEAQLLFSQALPEFRRTLGESHPWTLDTMNNQAILYEKRGLNAEAEQMFKKAWEGCVRVLGEDHPETLIVGDNLALLYRGEGRFSEAEPIFIDILAVRKRVLGDDHSETRATLNYLAHLYLTEGAYARAEPLFSRLVELNRRILGEKHSTTVSSVVKLARVYEEEDRYVDAEPLRREALADYKTTSPDTWNRYRGEELLGANLAHQRKYAEAEAMLLSAYEGLLQRQADIPEPVRRSTLDETGKWIGQLYQDWGQPEKAASWALKLQSANVSALAK
jgi:tetratricopeptide (TPR) repeat protein